MVDFDNVQLYFPNNSMDTIMSCFLDGSDVKDFRPKVVARAYHGITSMAYYNRSFFWTDGQNTWGEEYDPGFSQYRHNNLLLFDPPYSGFHLYHPKAQPTPGENRWFDENTFTIYTFELIWKTSVCCLLVYMWHLNYQHKS